MKARRTAAAAMALALLVSACSSAPSASQPATGSPASGSPAGPAPTGPQSLLPDGLWEVHLTTAELIAAGSPSDNATAGVYRWTFDGTRARIDLAGTSSCDADATAEGSAVRLEWHATRGCGGWDTIGWSVAADGLHLTLVANGSGGEAFTRALFEAKPWQRADGVASLDWPEFWQTCTGEGPCRNTLKAGSYTSVALDPALTYTVPDGWQNLEDTPGDFLLVAPGATADEVAAGTADGISVHASVRATNRMCATEELADSDEAGVGRTPEALAAEFQARPGLVTTVPQPVTVGSLTGLVMDIRMAPGWTDTCFLDFPVVPFMGGLPPSDFYEGVEQGMAIRLYLLARGDATLAVEIGVVGDGSNLDTYTSIVESFRFGT
jgi:hypothetical protein